MEILLPWSKEIILVVASYSLGCFSPGYYLVRLWTGQDIRSLGSGSAGATNVGRQVGPLGFAITFLTDFAKGAIAVCVAFYFGLDPWGVTVVMLAVVMGQIWPLQLGFRGGKGIATSIGAVLIYNYSIAVLLLGLFVIAFALFRNLTVSGLAAFAMSPAALFALALPRISVIGISALAVVLLIAHRENIREKIVGTSRRSEIKAERQSDPS